MVRFPYAWTVHEVPAPKLAASPALRSRQGPVPVCPAAPTSRSCTMESPSLARSSLPRCALQEALLPPAFPVSLPRYTTRHLSQRCGRSNFETKPIKDPASICGLVHCTVSSLPRRPALSFPLSALARRETDETFFSHTPAHPRSPLKTKENRPNNPRPP